MVKRYARCIRTCLEVPLCSATSLGLTGRADRGRERDNVADARTIDQKVDIHAPGVVVRKSACYFCHQNCGVLAYVKDGDVIRIEGNPEHTTNLGGLCCRGNIALKHLHHPGRINHPLKRAGAKGENKWEKISWDQAITEIAEKLNQIKAESGPEAVATAGGTLRTDDWSRRRFMNLFGSPNSFHNALLCWIPTFMVETAVSGWSPFETELSNSRVLILWGVNPGASNMPGMRGYSDLKKNGLKIIVVDPRYSETAAHADLWLPLRPGSDTALALAMINVIINEGLFDFEFVDEWCEGFGELADHVEEYTPEWAAPLTWLDPEDIRKAARMYAMNKPGNIQWGCTADQLGRTAGAGMHARAVLRAITGNLDKPGGDVMPGPAAYITDEELEANDRLPDEVKPKQIGYDKFKLTSWQGYGRIAEISKATWGKAPTAEWMCEAHGPSVFKAILTGDPYQVRALLVSATNPLNSYGDTKMVLAAIKKVEFLVVCDYWMTPTAVFADYVMPIAGALERPTIHTNYGVTDSIVATERAIDPLYERHTDYQFWRDLGRACGQTAEDWPWEREEDVYFYMLQPLGLPCESYDDFVENLGGAYYPPQHFYRYKEKGFCTPSRKVELSCGLLEELGYPALPTYIGPVESEVETPEVAKEYPLVLTTGGGFMPYHHSEHFQIKEIRYLYKDPRFTMNPRTAAKMGIKEGDWCWIETRRGRIKQRANLEETVDPRVIYAQRGWWYPERELDTENPYGCLDSNVNVITSVDDADCDPIGGSWANRGLQCKVYKVQEGDKVTNEWSIPGSASEPGIHETYSTSKLAYEVVPKERRHYPAEFEVPEGLEYDELRRTAYQPGTGYRYDQNSGWLIDDSTNVYYDLVTGYAYDPTANDLVDTEGNHYDMQTRELKVLSETPTFDMPEGLTWDVPTQQAWDPATGQVYDPNSGWLIDPNTNVYYDVVTRYAYDPAANDLVDAEGNHYDLETREPKGGAQ